jgi:hypothetical protein
MFLQAIFLLKLNIGVFRNNLDYLNNYSGVIPGLPIL